MLPPSRAGDNMRASLPTITRSSKHQPPNRRGGISHPPKASTSVSRNNVSLELSNVTHSETPRDASFSNDAHHEIHPLAVKRHAEVFHAAFIRESLVEVHSVTRREP